MKILLADRIGKSCISLEDGLSLYSDLIFQLKGKNRVDLDFHGVEKVYSPFLNGAFGKLFNFYDKEFILHHLSLCRISSEHLKKINEFIDDIDRLDIDREHRKTLEEFYDEDSLSDL